MDRATDAVAAGLPKAVAKVQAHDSPYQRASPSFGVDLGHLFPSLGHHFLQIGNILRKRVDSERSKLVHDIASLTQGVDIVFKRSLHEFSVIFKARNYCNSSSRELFGSRASTGLGFVNVFVNVLSGLGAEKRQNRQPLWACLSSSLPRGDIDAASHPQGKHLFDLALSTEQVAKRLDGVPVYTVSNSSNEFVLVSDLTGQKSLGLFCFRQEDAEALLAQVKDREPVLGRGARVVAVSLHKVYQLNTEGIAFRFLPDPLQVKHALQARSKGGSAAKVFDGVPVFQSDNLILRSNNQRFCPVFFCKEDLERALLKAFKKQQRGNPSLRVNTDIQVGSFEDVLKKMESGDEASGWEDIVFIPPGMDAFNHLGKTLSEPRDTVVG